MYLQHIKTASLLFFVPCQSDCYVFLCRDWIWKAYSNKRGGEMWGSNKIGRGYNLLLEILFRKHFALCIWYSVFRFDASVVKREVIIV